MSPEAGKWPHETKETSRRPAISSDFLSEKSENHPRTLCRQEIRHLRRGSLSHIYWDAYQKSDRTETKLLMGRLTSLPPQQLVPLAKSWLSPPSIHVTDRSAISADFDPSQRAFVIHRDQSAKAERLVLALDASADSPQVNPAFIVENWNGPAKVEHVSKGLEFDVSVHIGYVQHLGGDSLILFLPVQSHQPLQIRIGPAARERFQGEKRSSASARGGIFLAVIGEAPTDLLGKLHRGAPPASETGLTAGERYA